MKPSEVKSLMEAIKARFPYFRIDRSTAASWSFETATTSYEDAVGAFRDFLATNQGDRAPAPHELAKLAARRRSRDGGAVESIEDQQRYHAAQNARGRGLVQWKAEKPGLPDAITWEPIDTLHPVARYRIGDAAFVRYVRRIDFTMDRIGAARVNACLADIGITPSNWARMINDPDLAATVRGTLEELYQIARETKEMEAA